MSGGMELFELGLEAAKLRLDIDTKQIERRDLNDAIEELKRQLVIVKRTAISIAEGSNLPTTDEPEGKPAKETEVWVRPRRRGVAAKIREIVFVGGVMTKNEILDEAMRQMPEETRRTLRVTINQHIADGRFHVDEAGYIFYNEDRNKQEVE